MRLNSSEELIAEIKAGRMVILMDDEDRENEGDLIMAAEAVTPEAINFMAKYGRGLICLTLSEQRCKQLELPLMVGNSQDLHSTNFTLSIEAAKGVTTGISAKDRAVTIKTAVSAAAKPEDIVMPGHIFPLMARAGGVLTRAGHTEAGCDLARLAGMEPASAIVEILNEDGSMARRPDLEKFAKKHNLKIGTVADLIEHVIKHEKTVERMTKTLVNTRHGQFGFFAYQETTGGQVHIALVKGEISPDEPVLIRVHMQDTICDMFTIESDNCHSSLSNDLVRIAKEENAVLVVLRRIEEEGDLIKRIAELDDSAKIAEEAVPDPKLFGVGAQILLDIGVKKMRVLGTPLKLNALSGFGLEVTEYVKHSKISK